MPNSSQGMAENVAPLCSPNFVILRMWRELRSLKARVPPFAWPLAESFHFPLTNRAKKKNKKLQ